MRKGLNRTPKYGVVEGQLRRRLAPGWSYPLQIMDITLSYQRGKSTHCHWVHHAFPLQFQFNHIQSIWITCLFLYKRFPMKWYDIKDQTSKAVSGGSVKSIGDCNTYMSRQNSDLILNLNIKKKFDGWANRFIGALVQLSISRSY